MGDYHLQSDDKESKSSLFHFRNLTPKRMFGRSNDGSGSNDNNNDVNSSDHRPSVTSLELPSVKGHERSHSESLVDNSNQNQAANSNAIVIDVMGDSDATTTNDDKSSSIHKPYSAKSLTTNSLTGCESASLSEEASAKKRFHFLKRSKPRKKKKQRTNANNNDEEKLDTYSGVFLPCLAQIVGVIFFLRLPTITGQAGTIGTSAIVMICVISTFVTSLSLSAIASNGTIQAGGPYYIISRTLGVEIGGALGMLFYLGTTLGASMHVMGAVETLTHRKKYAYSNHRMAGIGRFLDSCPQQVWSLLLMFTIARIVSVGSKYVTGAANFFLLSVGLSIVSIMLGTVLFATGLYDGNLSDEERAFNDNLYPNYSPDPKTGLTPTFWNLLSIFYPATTGILAGTNRSSKLATPNQSIPIGTISAIAVTTLLYLAQVWLIGSVVSHETLIFNKLVLASVAFPSQLMAKIGMVTSCIGAALQCMAGAPQLLGAIAADESIPFLKFLTRKKKSSEELRHSPKSPWNIGLSLSTSFQTTNNEETSVASEKSEDVQHDNSVRAVWFTWAIASLGTLLGNIDRITPILTMFYLMMYGGINLCCFLLAWVDSPGFRPQFKYFSRRTALFGFFWCSLLGESRSCCGK
jgi:potassium/chloride transporter 4/5/6